MGEFAILTTGKRALMALVHSVVFLLLATWQMVMAAPASGMLGLAPVAAGIWLLCGIYAVVSAILLWLFAISRGWMEKSYFALCAVSAASGLLRVIVGDLAFPSGRYIRVIMLACAVLVGAAMIKVHSQIPERSSELEG